MEYRVLGALQVRVDAASAWRDVPGRAQRRLTALLALHVDHVVTADLIEEHLELSPGAVRTAVCRLRHHIGDDAVITVPAGYQLGRCTVDAVQFEGLVSGAAHAQIDDTRRMVQEALGLWRGRPFDEFADEPWARSEVTRLVELHATAVEDLAELLLDSDEPRAALALLAPLVDENPFRDRAHSQMIRAHAATGHPVEALHAFRDYRALLASELGTDPSGTLDSLGHAVASALAVDGNDLDPIVEVVEVIAAGLRDGPGRDFASALRRAARAERQRAAATTSS